ncbi:hypothetical protein DSM106972_095510 [Dulcicalothrix desertica PCC 7102]|uniref:Uncharacterized protein n=1 Tax=Dulcicalothrix desertica PCC 7102 TaxID=232991 RepID=A0A3S1A5L8_9CYAN|nr:hypothetical protein [Dulcicalothrix desertica]RUS93792.1 hypothetical protein DSM106972_095510 [Dulcicalothrix desertica PCC 7102]TWH62729.1 hypothetical protein CAL7102_00246 [Dulcicalothrix desertica PCC 7102]
MIDDEEFEQVLPVTVRRESLPKPQGEEIFKMPTWNCFCCHDTGWVQYHLAKRKIRGYDPNIHANPVCQNCNLGSRWLHLKGNTDKQLTKIDCQKLDRIERRNWEETTRLQFEGFQKNKQLIDETLAQLAMRKSLRKRARTIAEESHAQYKHDLERSNKYESVQGVQDAEA